MRGKWEAEEGMDGWGRKSIWLKKTLLDPASGVGNKPVACRKPKRASMDLLGPVRFASVSHLVLSSKNKYWKLNFLSAYHYCWRINGRIIWCSGSANLRKQKMIHSFGHGKAKELTVMQQKREKISSKGDGSFSYEIVERSKLLIVTQS